MRKTSLPSTRGEPERSTWKAGVWFCSVVNQYSFITIPMGWVQKTQIPRFITHPLCLTFPAIGLLQEAQLPLGTTATPRPCMPWVRSFNMLSSLLVVFFPVDDGCPKASCPSEICKISIWLRHEHMQPIVPTVHTCTHTFSLSLHLCFFFPIRSPALIPKRVGGVNALLMPRNKLRFSVLKFKLCNTSFCF